LGLAARGGPPGRTGSRPSAVYVAGPATGVFHANGMLAITLASRRIRAVTRFDNSVAAQSGAPGASSNPAVSPALWPCQSPVLTTNYPRAEHSVRAQRRRPYRLQLVEHNVDQTRPEAPQQSHSVTKLAATELVPMTANNPASIKPGLSPGRAMR